MNSYALTISELWENTINILNMHWVFNEYPTAKELEQIEVENKTTTPRSFKTFVSAIADTLTEKKIFFVDEKEWVKTFFDKTKNEFFTLQKNESAPRAKPNRYEQSEEQKKIDALYFEMETTRHRITTSKDKKGARVERQQARKIYLETVRG